jgi:hypothetical protein
MSLGAIKLKVEDVKVILAANLIEINHKPRSFFERDPHLKIRARPFGTHPVRGFASSGWFSLHF